MLFVGFVTTLLVFPGSIAAIYEWYITGAIIVVFDVLLGALYHYIPTWNVSIIAFVIALQMLNLMCIPSQITKIESGLTDELNSDSI
jgi:hypothetical protein